MLTYADRSAFNRARLELLEFAPSDVKLLSQLREVMDFTRESRATTETGDRPGTELWKKGTQFTCFTGTKVQILTQVVVYTRRASQASCSPCAWYCHNRCLSC
jgi:hypothetical protein